MHAVGAEIQVKLKLVGIHAVNCNSGTPLSFVFNELDRLEPTDAPPGLITKEALAETFMTVSPRVLVATTVLLLLFCLVSIKGIQSKSLFINILFL
jgi:hypothetical protein